MSNEITRSSSITAIVGNQNSTFSAAEVLSMTGVPVFRGTQYVADDSVTGMTAVDLNTDKRGPVLFRNLATTEVTLAYDVDGSFPFAKLPANGGLALFVPGPDQDGNDNIIYAGTIGDEGAKLIEIFSTSS